MIWKPDVSVAAIVERQGKFLLVEEETSDGPRFNQPAGHWEAGETLAQGVIRETWEETAHRFQPDFLLGVYRWRHPAKETVYLRFAFGGAVDGHEPAQPLDRGIIRAAWFTPEEIRTCGDRHRSPLVLRCVEDYLMGKRFPLELITHFG
ncbi:MAG TPA: NUDIX hydrolase [Betaproteobacteria bacterium]|nr:NUDIX hydrolase [Betaproteobacteria bacterium]